MEQVAVITVLSSLYGAVTVGLAAIFLREHVSRLQWAGIVAIFTGIALISR
jgi:drug/metabolite transporter (DMT)-like permease